MAETRSRAHLRNAGVKLTCATLARAPLSLILSLGRRCRLAARGSRQAPNARQAPAAGRWRSPVLRPAEQTVATRASLSPRPPRPPGRWLWAQHASRVKAALLVCARRSKLTVDLLSAIVSRLSLSLPRSLSRSPDSRSRARSPAVALHNERGFCLFLIFNELGPPPPPPLAWLKIGGPK